MIDLMNEIAQAEVLKLETLLKAVRQRYDVLFPDREMHIIFLQKDSGWNEQIDRIIAMLQKMKKIS